MKTYSNKIVFILSCILNLILMYILFNNTDKYKEQLQLNKSINDSLLVVKTQKGILKAKITSIETDSYVTFLQYESSNQEVQRLQQKVKEMKKYLKKRGSVTQVNTVVKVDTIIKTKIVYVKNDTLPTFRNTFSDKWLSISTITNKDNQELDLKVKFKPTITIGTEPTGFLGLGKGKPFVQFETDNPYIEIKSLKNYNVKPPKNKRFSIGPYVGYGTNGLGIGIGLQYGIIQF